MLRAVSAGSLPPCGHAGPLFAHSLPLVGGERAGGTISALNTAESRIARPSACRVYWCMPPDEHLRWVTPASPVLANLRTLTDGTRTLALLDLIQRSVPDEYKSHPPQWLYTHTTHVIEQPERTIRLSMPAVGFADGHGAILFQVGIPDPIAWARLRGTTLPPLQEGDRTIEFPALPDHPLW
jgi:hypothetical protein